MSDLLCEESDLAYTSNMVVKLTDKDYVMTEQEFGDIALTGAVMALYTIIPRHLYLTGELEVTFNHSVYKQTGAGSKPYEHEIWDWERDSVIFKTTDGESVYCSVETHPLPKNRAIVFITPLRHIKYELWDILDDYVETRLTRINTRPLSGIDLDLLYVGDNVIISHPNMRHEVVTSANAFNDLLAAARLNPKTLSIGSTGRILGLSPEATPYALKEIVCGAVVEKVSITNRRDGTRVYQPTFSNVEEDILKFKGGNYMNPLIDGAFTPTSSKSSDLSCINERILKIKPLSQKYPVRIDLYIKEFASKIRSGVKALRPLTNEEVLDEVSALLKTKYGLALDVSLERGEEKVHSAFQKPEAYSEVKAPRNISCVKPEHVAQYSRFVRALCSHMVDTDIAWYAFAKNPEGIADAVVRVAQQPHPLLATDFSKFDGTQSLFCRNVEYYVLLEMFDEKHHAEISKLCDGETFQRFRTEYDLVYNNENTKLSGGAMTSMGNTLINGCCNFISFRECGYDVNHAWEMMGVYGGDDGLTSHPRPSKLQQVINMLYMQIKPKIIQRGEPADFLARIWPSPDSDRGSFFDPVRALSKFHFTANTVDCNYPERALFRKSISLMATDSTNMLGMIAVRCLGKITKGKSQLVERIPFLDGIFDDNTSYESEDIIKKFTMNPVFPAPKATWEFSRDHYVRDLDPCYQYFVQTLGMTDSVVSHWLDEVFASSNVLEMPTLLRPEIAASITCEIEGQMIGVPEKAPIISDVVSMVCHKWLQGVCKNKKCKFEHPIGFCKDYVNKGDCKYGDKCKFKHYKCDRKTVLPPPVIKK
jgi:hypothetical protein